MAFSLNGLEGKVAVVTGAGRRRGLGRAIALALAQSGCDVAVTGSGRDPASFPDDEKAVGWRDAESVADELRALGRRALAAVCDVASLASVEALAARVRAELGGVDFVVNNAAAIPRARERLPVVEADPERWARIVDVNLKGTFHVCHVFGRVLVEQGRGGAIVNVSSIAGKRMAPNNSAYGSSKAAVHALTAAMSGEVAAHGVRVNALCTGIFDTASNDEIPKGETWDAMVRAQIPLGRAGRPEELAAMAVYLCSDQGAWITGQLYSVDGGNLPGR